MLQTSVYSESIVDLDGITTRVGEDALPFMNSVGMFVADGMGGSAGVRICRFDPDCFDNERLAEKLSAAVGASIQISGMEKLCDYARSSFSSLTTFGMKELYENPIANLQRLKKSGYVGSHALGLVMTGVLLKLEELRDLIVDVQDLEYCIRQAKDELYPQYCSVIELLGAEPADVSMSRIRYFGTTLSAAFFHENEDTVDVIFLNCGDSRSYVWDSEGFRQAADDQGRRRGMTSAFHRNQANPDDSSHIQISLEVKRYQKPCAVICMTDGVYAAFGSDAFSSSPLYMEGYFLNTLCSAASLEEAAEKIKQMLDVRGRMDDSNSLAATFFGFDSYEQVRAAAGARLEALNQIYLSGKPKGFLTTDYAAMLRCMRQEEAGQIRSLLREAFQLPIIQLYCAKRIEAPDCGKYLEKAGELQAEIREKKERIQDIHRSLCRMAEQNYVDFADADFELSDAALPEAAGRIVRAAKERATAVGDEICRNFAERETAVDAFFRLSDELHRNICASDAAVRFCAGQENDPLASLAEATLSWSEEMSGRLRAGMKALEECLAHAKRCAQELSCLMEQWHTENKRAEKACLNNAGTRSVMVIVSEWIAAADLLAAVPPTTIPGLRSHILQNVQKYRKYSDELHQLRGALEAAKLEAAEQYWYEWGNRDIRFVMSRNLLDSDPELKRRIEEKLSENEELARIETLSAEQTEVFRCYLDAHLAEVSDDKKADVNQFGWM